MLEQYIRVSTVLEPFANLGSVPPDLLHHAAERGTKVHKIIEGIVTGIGEFGCDDETQPYIESFKYWWDPNFRVIATEKRFYDTKLMLTGQVDLIIDTPNGLTIVDYKTSYRPAKTWAAQAGGYYHLASAEYDIKQVWFLHLNRDGKAPKVHEYPTNSDLFMKTYDVYMHFFHKAAK